MTCGNLPRHKTVISQLLIKLGYIIIPFTLAYLNFAGVNVCSKQSEIGRRTIARFTGRTLKCVVYFVITIPVFLTVLEECRDPILSQEGRITQNEFWERSSYLVKLSVAQC